jgi:Fic family protein
MELTDTLRQIDSLKQEAENLQPVKPELEKVFWDKFRLEFNYNSNHMEGNTLTYGHTQILLKSGDVVGKYNIRELQEMKAHDLALKVIRESADDPEFSLSQKFIREINETILVEPFYNDAITQDGRPTQKLIVPGEYKKTPNSVRLPNGEMFNYPSPEETPALMGDLIDWYEKETAAKELHPVQIAALFHYKIVRIHPFDDSNGRTSRLLMNYILLRNGYAPLVINSTDKKNYLIALNEADAGDIEAFVKYITALQLHWQDLYLKALKGESIEEPDEFDKEVDLMKKELLEKEGLKIEKSENVIKEVVYDSFLSLAKNVEQKLSKFDDLFLKTEINIRAASHFQKYDTLYKIENFLGTFITNLKDGGALQIEFNHLGFKKAGINAFNCFSGFSIHFENFIYKIEIAFSNEIKIEKLYHEKLSESEIDIISKKIAKIQLEEIKHRNNKL